VITVDPMLLRKLNSGQPVTFSPATCVALHLALTELTRLHHELTQACAARDDVLAYLDDCESGMGSIRASHIRTLLGEPS
jgi:hypothetical protein